MKRFFSVFVIMLLSCVCDAEAKIYARPGEYKNGGFRHDCRPGCYCEGNKDGKGVHWTAGDIRKGCLNRWSKVTKVLNSIGVFLCPADFPNSDYAAKSSADCYFRNAAGAKIKYVKVSCSAGEYLPKGSDKCALCPAGYYCPSSFTEYPSKDKDQGEMIEMPTGYTSDRGAKSEANKKKIDEIPCEAGKYSQYGKCEVCPATYYCPGATDSAAMKYECPAAVPENVREMRTYPEQYYADDVVNDVEKWGQETALKLKPHKVVDWSSKTGLKSQAECSLIYVGENMRGKFHHDNVKYNTVSEKYDVEGGDLYYLSVKPGYYLTEPYMVNGIKYCDHHNNDSAHYMLYRRAELCPPDKWCPGVAATVCNKGTHGDTMGLKEPEDVTCAKGQYLPANSNYCAPCDTKKYLCEGGNFKTTHHDQGRYVTYTQAQMLYGPSKKRSSDPAETCWGIFGDVGYISCVLGKDVSKKQNEETPESNEETIVPAPGEENAS